MSLLQRIQSVMEMQFFGVCTSIGGMLGVSVTGIRLAFIYASFLTIGSPIALYIILAFVKNVKKHLRNRRSYFHEI